MQNIYANINSFAKNSSQVRVKPVRRSRVIHLVATRWFIGVEYIQNFLKKPILNKLVHSEIDPSNSLFIHNNLQIC